ncbi:hypothetical protein DMUE_0795 [Dictyocoela muelleri]|nr:hypothetical protein DMUE_0795 [Dictyocoela muelleri]
MANYFWMLSERKRNVLVVENFYFRSDKSRSNRKCYWRCSNDNCDVRATTLGQNLVDLKGQHYKADDEEKIMVIQFKNLIVALIKQEPYKPPLDIYESARSTLAANYLGPLEISIMLPCYEFFRSSKYRWKSKEAPNGRLVEENDFDFFKLSIDRDMLLHVEFGRDLIMILGDIDYIRVFTESRVFNVVMDGTFKS